MEYDWEESPYPSDIVREAREKAKHGWRLVSVVHTGYQFTAFFEKELIVVRDDPPF